MTRRIKLRTIIKSYGSYASSSSHTVDTHHHHQVVRWIRIIINKSYGSYEPSQAVRELRIIIKSYRRYAPSSSRRKVDSHHHHQVVRELRTIKSYGSYASSSSHTVDTPHQVVRELRTTICRTGVRTSSSASPSSSRHLGTCCKVGPGPRRNFKEIYYALIGKSTTHRYLLSLAE